MTAPDQHRETVLSRGDRFLFEINTSGRVLSGHVILAALLLIVAIVLGTYDAWQIVRLRNQGAFLRFQQLDSRAFDQLHRQSGPGTGDLNFFAGKLAEAGFYG